MLSYYDAAVSVFVYEEMIFCGGLTADEVISDDLWEADPPALCIWASAAHKPATTPTTRQWRAQNLSISQNKRSVYIHLLFLCCCVMWFCTVLCSSSVLEELIWEFISIICCGIVQCLTHTLSVCLDVFVSHERRTLWVIHTDIQGKYSVIRKA